LRQENKYEKESEEKVKQRESEKGRRIFES
jgi:hypothetical protein